MRLIPRLGPVRALDSDDLAVLVVLHRLVRLHVGVEPHAPGRVVLHDPPLHVLVPHVRLVVAPRQVVNGRARDHGHHRGAVVEAGQEVGGEEVASQDADGVRVGLLLLGHQRAEVGEVVEEVDVRDVDDGELGGPRRGGAEGLRAGGRREEWAGKRGGELWLEKVDGGLAGLLFGGGGGGPPPPTHLVHGTGNSLSPASKHKPLCPRNTMPPEHCAPGTLCPRNTVPPDDILLPMTVYSAQVGVRLMSSPLIIASEHPIRARSWDGAMRQRTLGYQYSPCGTGRVVTAPESSVLRCSLLGIVRLSCSSGQRSAHPPPSEPGELRLVQW